MCLVSLWYTKSEGFSEAWGAHWEQEAQSIFFSKVDTDITVARLHEHIPKDKITLKVLRLCGYTNNTVGSSPLILNLKELLSNTPPKDQRNFEEQY